MLLDCFGIKDVAKINSQALQKTVFTAHPAWQLGLAKTSKHKILAQAACPIQNSNTGTSLGNQGEAYHQAKSVCCILAAKRKPAL